MDRLTFKKKLLNNYSSENGLFNRHYHDLSKLEEWLIERMYMKEIYSNKEELESDVPIDENGNKIYIF